MSEGRHVVKNINLLTISAKDIGNIDKKISFFKKNAPNQEANLNAIKIISTSRITKEVVEKIKNENLLVIIDIDMNNSFKKISREELSRLVFYATKHQVDFINIHISKEDNISMKIVEDSIEKARKEGGELIKKPKITTSICASNIFMEDETDDIFMKLAIGKPEIKNFSNSEKNLIGKHGAEIIKNLNTDGIIGQKNEIEALLGSHVIQKLIRSNGRIKFYSINKI